MGPTPHMPMTPAMPFTVSGYDGTTAGVIVIHYHDDTPPHYNYLGEILEERKERNTRWRELGANQQMRRQRSEMYKNGWRNPPPQRRGAKTIKN